MMIWMQKHYDYCTENDMQQYATSACSQLFPGAIEVIDVKGLSD